MSEKDNRRGFSFQNISPEELLGILTVATLIALILYQTLWIPSSPDMSVSYSSSQLSEAEQSGDQTEVPPPASSSALGEVQKVFINQATATELETLPGIGPAYAQRILEYREIYGKITSPEDLLEIRGIGEKTIEKILPHLDFS